MHAWHGYAFANAATDTETNVYFNVTLKRFNGTKNNIVHRKTIWFSVSENEWINFNESVNKEIIVKCGDIISVRVSESCQSNNGRMRCPLIPVIMTNETTNSAVTYKPADSSLTSDERTDIRVLLSAKITPLQQGILYSSTACAQL